MQVPFKGDLRALFQRYGRFLENLGKPKRAGVKPRPVLVNTTPAGVVARLAVPADPDRLAELTQACNWSGVDPDIRDFALRLCAELQGRGLPFYVHCARRSLSEQATLRNKGVSRASGPNSPHVLGIAVDIVHFSKGWALRQAEWDFVGAVGKEVARRRNLDIEWGGDWSFYDPAHWQIDRERREARDARAQARAAKRKR